MAKKLKKAAKTSSSALYYCGASLSRGGDFFAEWWPFPFSRKGYDGMSRYEKAQLRALFVRLVMEARKKQIRNTRPSYLRLVPS